MSKTNRNLDRDKRIKRVGKKSKKRLDKFTTLIYNYDSSQSGDHDDDLDEMLDQLYYEERNKT
jgi:hypothetical protein